MALLGGCVLQHVKPSLPSLSGGYVVPPDKYVRLRPRGPLTEAASHNERAPYPELFRRDS